MAIAPPRPCAHPKCPNLNCAVHQVEPWRTAARPIVQRIRGRALQARRRRLFAQQPWCAICRGPLPTLREMVRDHPIPLAEGGRDDATNEQPICHACDRVKTQAEAARGQRRSDGR